MWQAVMGGQLCTFGNDDPRELLFDDEWGPERTVRGFVLAALLVRLPPCGAPAVPQVVIQGAQVTGMVDLDLPDEIVGIHLDHAQTMTALLFESCLFDTDLYFSLGQLHSLSISRCVLSSINAEGVWIKGRLQITESLIKGVVNLIDAEVSRSVVISDLAVTGENGVAINAYGLKVGGSAFLCDHSIAIGKVHLMSASIGGNLGCNQATIYNLEGQAPNADGANIRGSVLLQDGFQATGEMRFISARIGGKMICDGASFNAPYAGDALVADTLNVHDDVSLASGFQATGSVRLRNAHIGGNLICEGGRFDNPGRVSLSIDGSKINGSVNLSLDAKAGFYAAGEVRLPGAYIGGGLVCKGGRIENGGDHALLADGTDIRGGAFLLDGFHAVGEVRFVSAHLGRHLEVIDAVFSSKTNSSQVYASGLILQNARMDIFFLHGPSLRIFGELDLRAARIRVLNDDPERLFASSTTLGLDGFVYEQFALDSPPDLNTRLRWLEIQRPGYHPQPFDQLAAVFRSNGQDHEATQVLIAKRRKRRGTLPNRWHKSWDRFLDCSVRYGWQPWRPLVLGVGVFLVALALVFGADRAGVVTSLSDTPSPYDWFIHTLDVFLPVVDLGVESRWVINAESGGGALAVVWSLWILKLVGWGTITLALAAVTRIVQRE
ncbi:MAG: hypothetical protein OXG79_06315 [Chloroflexi bacterium]|nr:hypothetical protein [Chloroflexota bacterium]